MSCKCRIEKSDGLAPFNLNISFIASQEVHKCEECNREIKPNEKYVNHYMGIHDLISGETRVKYFNFAICLDCQSVCNSLFCTFTYGLVWRDVRNLLEKTKAPPSADCMILMTKTARDKVCDILEEIWDREYPEEHFDSIIKLWDSIKC